MHMWTPEIRLADSDPPDVHAARLATVLDDLLAKYRAAVGATQHVLDAIDAAQVHRQVAIDARAQARAAGWTNRQLDEFGCPPLRDIIWEPHDRAVPRPRPGAG